MQLIIRFMEEIYPVITLGPGINFAYIRQVQVHPIIGISIDSEVVIWQP